MYNNFINIAKFKECENNIKEKYNLIDNDSLYFVMILKSLKEISETEYEIYYFLDGLKIKDTCNFSLKEGVFNEHCTIQERQNKLCKSIYDNNSLVNITNINEILDNILKEIKNEMTSGNFNLTNINKGEDIIIEEKGTKFIITTTDNQKNNIENKNMTIIKLNQCEIELRQKFNISGNIYILKVEKEQEGLNIPKIEYEIYALFNNNKLEQLNLSICEGYNIDIYIPYNISEKDNDKYDIKSGFYDDICYTYTTNDGLDISLKDRKDEFIKNNMTLCEENCDYERYDFKIGKAICSCLTKIKMPLISEISFDKNKIIEKFKDFKNVANVYILKC